MKKVIVIILLLSSVCFGDIFNSHLKPTSNNTLDVGTTSLLWRHIYGIDGTFSGTVKAAEFDFSGSDITTIGTITAGTFTDGTFSVSGGIISAGTWQGDMIAHEYGGLEADVSGYTDGLYGMASGVTADIDTSLEIATAISDETGSGLLVFGTSPTLAGTITAPGIEITSAGIEFVNSAIIYDVNNISADIATFETYGLHIINSSGAGITGTLADGTKLGQSVKFVCKVAGNNIDITVSNHVTSDPEVIRLDTAKEWVELVWDDTDWVEVDGNGQTYP